MGPNILGSSLKIIIFLKNICYFFKLFQNRTSKEELQQEVEMAWDDSALNITVNPIDVSYYDFIPWGFYHRSYIPIYVGMHRMPVFGLHYSVDKSHQSKNRHFLMRPLNMQCTINCRYNSCEFYYGRTYLLYIFKLFNFLPTSQSLRNF